MRCIGLFGGIGFVWLVWMVVDGRRVMKRMLKIVGSGFCMVWEFENL